MSAADAMYRHRYGGIDWNTQFGRRKGIGPSSRDVGDAVAAEMFGEDPFDPSSIPELDDQPLFAPQPGAPAPTIPPSVNAAVQTFMAKVKSAFPYVTSYDVRGGQAPSGAGYAQLTIDAHDPHGFIQRTASWALQAAGMNNVSVTSTPVALTPGKVVLVFSQGAVPAPTVPSAPAVQTP